MGVILETRSFRGGG